LIPEGKYPFNVRVYGICLQDGKCLITAERIKGISVIKFPGGGLEYGEGPADCIVREILEETGLRAEVTGHFYTTDFFVPSAFGPHQIISIYFSFRLLDPDPGFPIWKGGEEFSGIGEGEARYFWIQRKDITPDVFTFPIDKRVGDLLMKGN
jgi:8-oxo-dGTP diphosphatase